MKTYHILSALALLVFLAGCKNPQLGSLWGEKLQQKNSSSETKLAEATSAASKKSAEAKVSGPGTDGHNVEFVGYEPESGSAGGKHHDSKWVNDHLMRAHREADAGRFEEAKRNYRLVLEQEPLHPTAHHRMAIISDEQKNFHAADYHYQRALAANPNDPNVLSDLGWSYILQGKYHDAEEILLSALVYDRVHRKSLDRLGYLYFQQGDEDRAKEMLGRGCTPLEAQQKIASLLTQQRPAPNVPRNANPAPLYANQWPGGVRQAAAIEAGTPSEHDAQLGARRWPQTQTASADFASGNAAPMPTHQPQIAPAMQQRYESYSGTMISPAGQDRPVSDSRLSAEPSQYWTGAAADHQHAGFNAAGSTADCPQGQCRMPGLAAGIRTGPAQLPTVNADPLESMPFFPTVAAGSPSNTAGHPRAAAATPNVVPAGTQPNQHSWPTASSGVQPAGYEDRTALESWPHAPNSRGSAGPQYSSPSASQAFEQNQASSPGLSTGGYGSPTSAERQAAILGMNAGANRGAFPVIDGNTPGAAPISGTTPWPRQHNYDARSGAPNGQPAGSSNPHQFSGLGAAGPWSNDQFSAGNPQSQSWGQPAATSAPPNYHGRALNAPTANAQARPGGGTAFPNAAPQQWPAAPHANAHAGSPPNNYNWPQPNPQQPHANGAGSWPAAPANSYPQYNPTPRSDWQQPPPSYSPNQPSGFSPSQGW